MTTCAPGRASAARGRRTSTISGSRCGARKEKGSARYPVDPTAIEHHAGVTEDEDAGEAYARWGEPRPGPPPAIEW
jgi:hypothetical protein